jgi:hypothetical protein
VWSVAGLRLSEAAADSRHQRRALRRRMAIRAIPEEAGHDRSLPANLCARWQLLSTSYARQLTCARRCGHGKLARSLARTREVNTGWRNVRSAMPITEGNRRSVPLLGPVVECCIREAR